MPETEISFTLSPEDMAQLQKAVTRAHAAKERTAQENLEASIALAGAMYENIMNATDLGLPFADTMGAVTLLLAGLVGRAYDTPLDRKITLRGVMDEALRQAEGIRQDMIAHERREQAQAIEAQVSS